MSGTRCALPDRIASTGSVGRTVVADDRTDRECAQPLFHALLDEALLCLHQLGRGCLHQGVGHVLGAHAEQGGEPVGELVGNFLRPHQARRRALRDRAGEQAFGRGHRQQRGGDARARALAEDGDIARVTAELGDVVPNPLQSQHQIAQIQVAVDGDVRGRQRRQVQTAQHAEPVVDRYVHAAAARQRGAVVYRGRRAAHDVPAAVDEHHHRQRFFAGLFGGDDVEGEAVFAHGLVLADTDQGVATLLGCAVGEAVAVPHARPGLGGQRRPES